MRRVLPLTVAALFLPFLAPVRAQPGKDDAKNIQGTWAVTAFEKDGKKETPPQAFKLKIGPDKIEPVGDDDPADYKLGVEKDLGTIDITPLKGPEKGKTVKGLYELKGDELKLCFPDEPGKERPKEFTSKGGYSIGYLKRDKP
jgi:uncharacterized protein (TIGR03067 family)